MRIGINALGPISQDTGGRTYLVNFVRACAELDLPHEFYIFYSGPTEDLWGELPPNFHKIVIPGTSGSSWAKVLGEQFLLPLRLIGKKLDVVYFPGNFLSPFVLKPMVVAIRSTLYYHFPKEVPLLQRLHRKALSWVTVRLARRILVPSQSIARDIVNFMGARPDKITVIPHGVDINKFAPRPEQAEIDRRLEAMGVRRPYFLFVSALWHYKGALQFVESVHALRQHTRRADLTAVMAGKGIGSDRYRRLLRRQIQELQMQDEVRLVGHRPHDELAYLYWGAEALVFPSYYESFGNPLIEAMAAGTPIVASNRHATPETVGDAALIVDPDDTDGFCRAMQDVMTDVHLRTRLIEAGRERAKSFSWSQAVGSTIKLMETSSRPRILLFGYLPPPYFGPSTAYRALLHSEFPRHFDVTFINLSVVTEIRELEQFRPGKLLKLAKFFVLELQHLLTCRFDFICYPVAFNRNAFLKDALLLALGFRVPTVLWAHGNNLPDFRERSPHWVRRLIDRTVSRAAAAIVLGERLRFNFEPWLPPERIFVVPLGIEPPQPLANANKRADAFTVLYLGNLIHEKGVFVLLEAALLVLARQPNARFVFAGAWWREQERIEAEQFIRAHGLAPKVEFIGLVTGEPKWRALAEADVLAFPTFYYFETFGFVLLEAMWAGLPVVTTRRASIPEIIQDGVNGLLVEEQNPSDLAEKILQLADDPGLRERMGEANRKKFASYYTHEQYGQRMIEVFEQLSARHRRSSAGSPQPPRVRDARVGRKQQFHGQPIAQIPIGDYQVLRGSQSHKHQQRRS